MGDPQSSLAFLIASHTKKGSVTEGEGSTSSDALIDDRAREAARLLSEYMIERYGSDVSTHPKHDQELWEKAIGVRRKGRVYCTGSSSDPSFVLTGTPSADSGSSYAQTRFEEVEKVKEKMEKMLEEHEKTRSDMEELEERLRKEVEDGKAATEAVKRQMDELVI
ncbi:uncharacterized protein [Rutidosis leptorrhynchoides]|uniref:uncharacterized protein n=1 Tax=Rutidosis leptorrhynchoides TaxID=125765 RepID=UPI003A995DB2